jgi:hypothetical protein
VPKGSLKVIYNCQPSAFHRFCSPYLDVVDVVAVPRRTEELVAEPENENVLDHLLAQVVVNAEQLVLSPVRRKRTLELSGAGKVLAKRLLDLLVDGQRYGPSMLQAADLQ